MSLSGSNDGSLLPYTAQDMLEEATSRAGIPPEAITSEIVEKYLTQLNLCFTELVNRGYQLWKRQKLILPLYQNTAEVPLPAGYNIVTNLNTRTMSRQTGTAFSDQGGDPDLAFDDDFDTACTQTAANGAIGCEFTSQTQVTTVGVLSGGSGTFALFFEYSQDGVTYTAVDSGSVVFTGAGEWAWFDLDGPPPSGAYFWRVRSVGTVPFSAAEIFFGNTPSEIPLGPAWSLDDYFAMPNKTQAGTVTNWYQQRNASAPVLYVWQVPSAASKYTVIVVWATQYLDQVSQIMQGLDLPQRWFEAITAEMARRLCRSLKEADKKLYPLLKQEAAEALWLAQSEERDPAPTRYDLGVSYYTSG